MRCRSGFAAYGLLWGVVAGAMLIGSTHASGTVRVDLVPRGLAILDIGDSVTIDIIADWSGVPGGLSLAGFQFEISGSHAVGLTPVGTLEGIANPAWTAGVNVGAQVGPLSLEPFAGGQLPPGFGGAYSANPALLGSFTYTYLGRRAGDSVADEVEFSLANYYSNDGGALSVYISASGTQSRASYGIGGGVGHTVEVNPTTVSLIPQPSAWLALAGAALGTHRRRR